MKTILALLLFFISNLAMANEIWVDDPSAIALVNGGGFSERYRILGDFNDDGIQDMALSDDINSFGNGGGEFTLYLWNKKGKYQESGKFWAHPTAGTIAIEKWEKEIRLWAYSHGGGGIGGLGYYEVREKGLSELHVITIHPGDSGTVMGNAIYDAVFKHSDVIFKVQRSTTKDGEVKWE